MRDPHPREKLKMVLWICRKMEIGERTLFQSSGIGGFSHNTPCFPSSFPAF